MFVNSSELIDTKCPLRVYNLYPYIIHAVDVYFITSDANLQRDILEPDSEGNPRIFLSLDGNKFPLVYKAPGDSPLNPIQYSKSIEQAKFSVTERNSLTNRKVTGFVGSDQVLQWVPSLNINNLNDYIELILEVKSIPTQVSTRYGYGSSPSLISLPDNPTGKYGYGSSPNAGGRIISYGGYGNDFLFKDSAIIIEASQKKRYDYMHNYDRELQSSSVNGWGEGLWGGEAANGFGS